MKKLVILIIPIILLCGCDSDEDGVIYNKYVDKDNCVMYLSRYQGGITPMYNSDGSLKLNKKCLEEKQKSSDK